MQEPRTEISRAKITKRLFGNVIVRFSSPTGLCNMKSIELESDAPARNQQNPPPVKTLIIGKNARLVRQIVGKLPNCTFISHKEVDQFDFSGFDVIFVFSWDRTGMHGNAELLDELPAKKVVFISTSAVLALQRRRQWNRYPNDKQKVEFEVLKRGGRVMRIGVTDPDHALNLTGTFPFTSLDQIAEGILNWKLDGEGIVELYELISGQLDGSIGIVSRFLERLSRWLPSGAVWQVPVQGIARLIGSKSYGYTADANASFFEEILVGYGALGSCYDRMHPSPSRLLLVSGRPDEELNDCGFRNTRVGLGLIGLSRLWHGVMITRPTGNPLSAFKDVPLWVRRPSAPAGRRAIAHVVAIQRLDGYWRLDAMDARHRERRFYTRQLTLAAGPLENVRLLAGLRPVDCQLSDHEIGMVGRCTANAAIQLGAVVPWGPFWRRAKVFLDEAPGVPFLVEIRPLVPSKHGGSDQDANFYLDSTRSLLIKLFKGLSLSRLNEAFFNKFGWAIPSRQCSVFVQALAKDTIKFSAAEPAGSKAVWRRERLPSTSWIHIQQTLKSRFPEFVPENTVSTVDAQHIHGGAELRRDDLISHWCNQGVLRIIGSPTTETLGAMHHTRFLQAALAQK